MFRRYARFLALALALPLAACDGDSNFGTGTGRVSIMLTDAAGDFQAAVVTISEIYLQGEGEEGGRVVLSSTPVTTDLLTLANDVEELVEDAVIPAGNYAQLRFVISGGYIAVENAQGGVDVYATAGYTPPAEFALPGPVKGTLQCPSCAQSGIKVNLPGGATRVEGDAKVLLVDFDVSQSFGKQAGQSGQWVMTPVLQGTELELSASVQATLKPASGVTLPTVGGTRLEMGSFKARLSNGNGAAEELALTDANNDGTFEATFQYLVPGAFTLEFVAPAGVVFATNPATPIEVSVESGRSETRSAILTSVTAQ